MKKNFAFLAAIACAITFSSAGAIASEPVTETVMLSESVTSEGSQITRSLTDTGYLLTSTCKTRGAATHCVSGRSLVSGNSAAEAVASHLMHQHMQALSSQVAHAESASLSMSKAVASSASLAKVSAGMPPSNTVSSTAGYASEKMHKTSMNMAMALSSSNATGAAAMKRYHSMQDGQASGFSSSINSSIAN